MRIPIHFVWPFLAKHYHGGNIDNPFTESRMRFFRSKSFDEFYALKAKDFLTKEIVLMIEDVLDFAEKKNSRFYSELMEKIRETKVTKTKR